MWNKFDNIWQNCLTEAWNSYCSGSVPIGAVVINEKGKIISKGRNQSYELSGYQNTLFGNPLAHAEINALINVNYSQENIDKYTLFSTLEPCPLCMGGIYMSGIEKVYYGAIEPNAGSSNILGKTTYLRQKKISVSKVDDQNLEKLIFILLVDFYLNLNHKKSNNYINIWTKVKPEYVSLGRLVHKTSLLSDLRESASHVSDMVNTIGARYFEKDDL
jgi:tRNA(adenine34) deaminase